MAPARQPRGIPVGGQFAATEHAESEVSLAPQAVTHTAELTGTIELHNQWFDQLPEWPAGMPEPEVSFGFDDGKAESYVTVDGKMMTFWNSDMNGTVNDTDNGDNPWEDFDEEDQKLAQAWGKAVHERIDSATYGVMIEGSHSPAVHDIILAQAVGKEPATAAKAAPDLRNEAERNVYLIDVEAHPAAVKSKTFT